MRRRKFIQTVSAVSTGIAASPVLPIPRTTHPGQWLHHLTRLAKGEKTWWPSSVPGDFLSVRALTRQHLIPQHYSGQSSSVFSFPELNVAMEMLEWNFTNHMHTDYIVPVYRMAAGHKWSRTTVLNTFEIEALCRAGELLVDGHAALAPILIPTARYGNELITSQGKIIIAACLKNGATATSISIWVKGKKILNENFSSGNPIGMNPTASV